MAERVLITGITGFVGSHLADYALARGDCEVIGTKRWHLSRLRLATSGLTAPPRL